MLCDCRLVNGILGVTWRLAYGVDNTQEPEGAFFHFHSPLLIRLVALGLITSVPFL